MTKADHSSQRRASHLPGSSSAYFPDSVNVWIGRDGFEQHLCLCYLSCYVAPLMRVYADLVQIKHLVYEHFISCVLQKFRTFAMHVITFPSYQLTPFPLAALTHRPGNGHAAPLATTPVTI